MGLVGYGRVSTDKQDVALQTDALQAAGCVRIFTETASGEDRGRPELARCLEYLRPGDVLVVWRLDRLGRSVQDLIEIVRQLEELGVALRSLHESIDTTTPGGTLVFHLFAALAQFERALIVERTRAGLAVAAAQGRHGGRPTVMTPERVQAARQMRADGDSYARIASVMGVGASSVRRALDTVKP